MNLLRAGISSVLVWSMIGCAASRTHGWDRSAEGVDAHSAAAPASANPLADGDAAWESRKDPAHVDLALTRWQQASAQAASPELFAKIARAHYLRARYAVLAGDMDLADRHFDEGAAAAERGLAQASPEFSNAVKGGASLEQSLPLVPVSGVAALYWYAIDMGRWTASRSVFTQFKYKDELRAAMKRVAELDPSFYYAGPERYDAAYEALTSGILGGSLEKSEEHYKKAISAAPTFLGNKVDQAEFLCPRLSDSKSARATFEQLLKDVIATDPAIDPAIEAENRVEQQSAQKLLARESELF